MSVEAILLEWREFLSPAHRTPHGGQPPHRPGPVVLTREAADRLIATAERTNPRAAWALMVYLGSDLTVPELCALQPEDVLPPCVRVGTEQRELGGQALGGIRRLLAQPSGNRTLVGVGVWTFYNRTHRLLVRAGLSTPGVRNWILKRRPDGNEWGEREGTGRPSLFLVHPPTPTMSLYLAVEPDERRAAVELI